MDDDEMDEIDETTPEKSEVLIDDEKEIDEDVENVEEAVEEEFDIEELTKLYDESEKSDDKTIKETSKMISEAIKDRSWQKKKLNDLYPYDTSDDSLVVDAKMKDIYKKKYITNEYIFKDDTIKVIMNKVSVSLSLNPKFGEKAKIIPSLQYFWSNYMVDGKKDSVMLGQKWIRRNELLKIDVEPNENLKVYENLRNNLSYLRDSFGQKIKREDDSTNILREYNEYMTNNEIMMLDLYNELGINYSVFSESLKNLYEVYVNIYFPLITFDRLSDILGMLSGKKSNEIINVNNRFLTLNNDAKLESEIYLTVEKAKEEMFKYSKYFEPNHIIHSIIHVNMNSKNNISGTVSDTVFNLYRIFDNFIVSEEYPFLLYQTSDGKMTYKIFTKEKKLKNQNMLLKWFESAPYGITFRCKMNEKKFISVELKENGRIEYKITWKEPDKATVEDINKSYEYIRKLIKKINSENKKIKFIIPEDERFKYAFINTIQKFSIPEKFEINHNDLSEFSRFFFPYISLVIEPRKRESKKKTENTTSKYGTYLRYKRINKYENRTRMHLRILYFLRNYEFYDKELINEIAKQFNITEQDSAKELDYVRDKYSKAIKKSRKVLKKLKNIPKSKPAGINIDIQGRSRDRYKIRITGARDKSQLNEILDFMKVLIYLYTETYLYKRKNRQKLKDKLKLLTKIAKRRNKVREEVNYKGDSANVKTITSLDKKRLGFRPEKGQSQWTRSCQNSGNDKKRRPETTPGDNVTKLVKAGYKLNPKTKMYEKKVKIKTKGKEYEVVLKAVKLEADDSKFNFYTCDPSENGKHMFIGFLPRGNNPNDLCMPCCFKKDQMESKNEFRKNFFLKCIGDKKSDEKIEKASLLENIGDKIYILQDTNKIQEGRFHLLPKNLDNFFNKIWKRDKKIVSHYLTESNSGYFFKFTVKDDNFHFLAAISSIYDKSIDDLKKIMIDFIKKDKNNKFFTYLNNGDIRESFNTKEDYINYIENSLYLEYSIVGELLGLPGLLTPNGINFYILNKKITIIKKSLEKDQIEEEYYLNCLNYENNFEYLNENKDFVILINEKKYLFPIFMIKKSKEEKKINIIKKYTKKGLGNKIIDEMHNYYNVSCIGNILKGDNYNSRFCKLLIRKIETLKNYSIVMQYYDDRKKCKYLKLNNKLIIPVESSGIWYKYPIEESVNLKEKDFMNLKDKIKNLATLEKGLKLDYIPYIGYYEKKTKDTVILVSLLLKNGLTIRIKPERTNEKTVKKYNIKLQFHSLDKEIDKEIRGKNIPDDDRNLRVKQNIYHQEGYNLFRLEFSLYLSKNKNIRQDIINIVRDKRLKRAEKKKMLRNTVFKLISKKLARKSQKGGAKKFMVLKKAVKDIKKYKLTNIRNYCSIHRTAQKCNENHHCSYENGVCYFSALEKSIVEYINRLVEDMVRDKIGFKELIQEDIHYVSDIVDYNQYTFRDNQKIFKPSNINMKTILEELFGKDNIPKIGRRHKLKKSFKLIQDEYPNLVKIGESLIQEIISNLDSVLRSYANGYYWVKNSLYDIKSRNLGYFSDLQTRITYFLKAHIIDWIRKEGNFKSKDLSFFNKKYGKKFNLDLLINQFRKSIINTDGILELYILSYIFDYPIFVYNNYNKIIYIYHNGDLEVNKKNIDSFKKEESIHIKFDFDGNSKIPKKIYSIYN